MEHTLYSNYFEDLPDTEEVMERLEELGEELTSENAYTLINEDIACDFEYFIDGLTSLLKTKYYIATGTCGLWYGRVEGGMVIANIQDFFKLLKDCEYLKFIDKDGHLLIECSHHDGNNYYELRELNDKGVKYYQDNYDYEDRRKVCEKLFSPNYSKLPRIGKHLYGC